MKLLYVECKMGIAGDMLVGALSELVKNPKSSFDKINSSMPDGVTVSAEKSSNLGIAGTAVRVSINGEEEDEHKHGNSLKNVTDILDKMNVAEHIRLKAKQVYDCIAEAESEAHGVPVTQIHFHEVGSLDAIADIVSALMLIDELAPDKIVFSPLNLGGGTVSCAHGILPVPAPATAALLRGLPCYGGTEKGELTTTTGAAMARALADGFDENPEMNIISVGYGLGKKIFSAPNVLRVFYADIPQQKFMRENADRNAEIVFNVDDMTGEAAAYAMEVLFREGALDAYISPLTMKKGRQGMLFTCICEVKDVTKLAEVIFKHTTTLGVRVRICERIKLDRHFVTVRTRYGDVPVKEARAGITNKFKPEFDNTATLARAADVSVDEVKTAAIKEYLLSRDKTETDIS